MNGGGLLEATGNASFGADRECCCCTSTDKDTSGANFRKAPSVMMPLGLCHV